MQVLVITGSYPPRVCGIADYTALLNEALFGIGYGIEVVTSQQSAETRWPVEAVGKWNLITMFRILRTISSRRPDVVIIQFQLGIYSGSASICFLPMLARLLTKARVITTFHDLNGPPSWGRLHRLGVASALLGSDHVVVCSKKQLAAVKRIPALRDRASLIPVGPAVRQRDWTGYPEMPRITCFGFVWRNRGLEEVIDACAQVCRSGTPIRLAFVGGVVDRDYADELIGYADASGLSSKNLEFTGELPEDRVGEVLANSTMAVLPFPTGVSTGRSTFVTCASLGMPIVTTCCPENWPEELTGNSPAVMSYPPGDVALLAQHIRSVCTDQALGRQLGRNIGMLAGNWTWASIARRYAEAFGEGRSLA